MISLGVQEIPEHVDYSTPSIMHTGRLQYMCAPFPSATLLFLRSLIALDLPALPRLPVAFAASPRPIRPQSMKRFVEEYSPGVTPRDWFMRFSSSVRTTPPLLLLLLPPAPPPPPLSDISNAGRGTEDVSTTGVAMNLAEGRLLTSSGGICT